MSEGSALDPRELLRLLAEQQANISQLQRLVIEHVLAEARLEAIAVAASSPTTAVPTGSEPMPAIVVAPMPTEPLPPGGSGVTANEPEQTPETMPDTNADSAETVQDAPTPSGAPSDQPAPADSPFGEASLLQSEPAASPTVGRAPVMGNPRVSRYLKGRPVASAKQVTSAELNRISRLCDVGDAARLVVQFGEYRGLTLFQVAQADPDYIRSLALTAQRPQVRAAAIQVVRALEASERPANRRRSTKSSAARRQG